ncbi:MAG: hypothetical protein ACOH5I_25885 [Oligoflexus sp.]
MSMLSANADYYYNQLVGNLPPKERKAYRERFRYWLSKGLPQAEAERRASLKSLMSFEDKAQPVVAYDQRLSTIRGCPRPEVVHDQRLSTTRGCPRPEVVHDQKTCQPENLPARKSAEPTKEEIDAVIQELRDRGQIIENPQMVGQANVLQLPVSRKPASQKTCRAENPLLQLAEYLPLAGYLLVVAAASALLISASLQVFGNSWQGWLKASLLEAGILLFAVSRAHSSGEWLLKRLSAAFLICLSLFVLHTGVESQRSDQLSTVKATNTTLTDLTHERDGWQKTHDDYPENRISDRRDAMKEISRLNDAIRVERAAISQSLDSSVINLKSNSEMMIRVALLLISIVFSHALVGECRQKTRERLEAG